MRRYAVFLIVVALAAGSLSFEWFIYKPYVDQSTLKLGGYWSDLYPRWYGTRELLLHHRDPYSDEITREIQVGFAGRPTSDPKSDQEAFAYPIFIALPLAPSIFLDFDTVSRFFGVLVWMAAVLSPALWASSMRVKLRLPVLVLWTVAYVFSMPAMAGLVLQQISVPILLILALSFFYAESLPALAGTLLAVSWLKPQLSIFPSFLLLAWAASHRTHRKLLWAFSVTLLALCGIGELLMRGWIHEWFSAMRAYRTYTGPSISTMMMGETGSLIFTGALVLVYLLVALNAAKSVDLASDRIVLALALGFAIEVLTIPNGPKGIYNQIALLPAVMGLWKLRSLYSAASVRWLYRLGIIWLAAPGIAASIAVLKLVSKGRTPVPTFAPFNIALFFPLVLLPLTAVGIILAQRGRLARLQEVNTVSHKVD